MRPERPGALLDEAWDRYFQPLNLLEPGAHPGPLAAVHEADRANIGTQGRADNYHFAQAARHGGGCSRPRRHPPDTPADDDADERNDEDIESGAEESFVHSRIRNAKW